MNKILKIAFLPFTLLFVSCATSEKTEQFQLKLQKIVTAPGYQQELFNCYTDLLKKKSEAEGTATINYTFLSDIRKEITINEVSPSLDDQPFKNCIVQKAENLDIRPAYSDTDSDRVYRGTILGSYSFKKMLISPKR